MDQGEVETKKLNSGLKKLKVLLNSCLFSNLLKVESRINLVKKPLGSREIIVILWKKNRMIISLQIEKVQYRINKFDCFETFKNFPVSAVAF